MRELFGVEQAHLVRRHADGSVTSSGADDGGPLRLDPSDRALVARALAEGAPVTDKPLRRLRPRRDERPRAVAAPLTGRAGVLGALVITDPLGDVRDFRQLDLRLLEGVSRQLGQAVERGEELARLEWAATHDPVTDLLNGHAWRDEARRRLATAPDQLVLLVDVARLRVVNDVFGRDTGDVALLALADRLRDLATDGIAARIGGHHYALMVPRPADRSAADFGRRLRDHLQRPLRLRDMPISIGVHVGVASSPRDSAEPDLLLRRAEAALDVAKDDPSGVAAFLPEHERDAVRALRLYSDLKAALAGDADGGELYLDYQRKVRLDGLRTDGAEALARWRHPSFGAVAPDEFVAIAEQTGLIDALTDWVLRAALADCAAWRAQGHDTALAVNLSAKNLLDASLAGRVEGFLREAGVPAGLLTLELTETSVMTQPARSVVVLQALDELGVRLSIDDFGTGHSSLAYLRQLPVDEVKLDRSFLAPLRGDEGRAEALLRDMIQMVHSLDLHVVVEGVEDEQTCRTVEALGADAVQGWYTGRPGPAGALHA